MTRDGRPDVALSVDPPPAAVGCGTTPIDRREVSAMTPAADARPAHRGPSAPTDSSQDPRRLAWCRAAPEPVVQWSHPRRLEVGPASVDAKASRIRVRASTGVITASAKPPSYVHPGDCEVLAQDESPPARRPCSYGRVHRTTHRNPVAYPPNAFD
jgi:hypothetical protein